MWAENGIAFLHNGIRRRKIQEPELDNVIPGILRKAKGIRVKFKKIGYESILIGGMSAGVIR